MWWKHQFGVGVLAALALVELYLRNVGKFLPHLGLIDASDKLQKMLCDLSYPRLVRRCCQSIFRKTCSLLKGKYFHKNTVKSSQ